MVALRNFCKRKGSSADAQDERRDKKKRDLASFLASGGASKDKPLHKKKGGGASQEKQNENKKKRLELGWLHQYDDGDTYTSIRAKDGGGTRVVELPGSSRKRDIIDYAKKLFFPNGSSPVGSVNDLAFQLENFQQESVQPTVTYPDGTVHPFTLYNYTRSTRLSKTRMYIMTRAVIDSDGEVGIEIPL